MLSMLETKPLIPVIIYESAQICVKRLQNRSNFLINHTLSNRLLISEAIYPFCTSVSIANTVKQRLSNFGEPFSKNLYPPYIIIMLVQQLGDIHFQKFSYSIGDINIGLCDILTQRDAVAVPIFNSSASHLPVLSFSTRTLSYQVPVLTLFTNCILM